MRHRFRFPGGARAAATAALVLCASPLSVPASAADDTTPPSTVLSGVVYLPDGVTPARAAVVDLMRADPVGQPIPGSAFRRGVTDLDGRFTLDPPEHRDLVARAEANGGAVPVAIQIGDLAPNGSIDPGNADGTLRPDTSLYTGLTVLRLLDGGGDADTFTVPATSTHLSAGHVDLGGIHVSPEGAHIVGEWAEYVLRTADDVLDPVTRQAAFAGMFTDPDLVAGNENLDDPDVVPPLGAISDTLVPVLDPVAAEASGSSRVSPPISVGGSVGDVALPHPDEGKDDGPGCGKDPHTLWVKKDMGNSPEGTRTYVFLDTFTCARDSDPHRDEVGYRWEGYTANEPRWSIWRLKFRNEAAKGSGFLRKRPDPAGDVATGSSRQINWHVGFEKVATFGIGGTYTFTPKKIHPWYWDDDGRLFHVSWICDQSPGCWTKNGFNNGGGFTFDIPEGADPREGVANTVTIWRCYYPPERDPNEDPHPDDPRPWCDGGR